MECNLVIEQLTATIWTLVIIAGLGWLGFGCVAMVVFSTTKPEHTTQEEKVS